MEVLKPLCTSWGISHGTQDIHVRVFWLTRGSTRRYDVGRAVVILPNAVQLVNNAQRN